VRSSHAGPGTSAGDAVRRGALDQPALTPGPPRAFFGALESLRGIAALAVGVYHITWLYPLRGLGFIRNGYLMVDFFFVLSGFVICHSYGDKLRTGRDLVRYLWLRFGRLYPLHLAILLLFVGLALAAQTKAAATGAGLQAFSHLRVNEIVASLALVQGLGVMKDLEYNFPSWSISTEFYTCAVFGVVAVLSDRHSAVWRASALISFSAFGALLLSGQRSLTDVYTFGFPRCIMGFFLGIVAYQTFLRLRPWLVAPGFGLLYETAPALALGAAIVLLGLKTRGPSDFGLLPAVAVLVPIVAAAPDSTVARALCTRPMAWLGKVSYSIYMVHAVVILAAEAALRHLLTSMPRLDATTGAAVGSRLVPVPLVGAVFTVLTVGAICALSHVTFTRIEQPFRKRSRLLADTWLPVGSTS
jgi:hypothetical protein